MVYFHGTKTQISPCILSKARYALKLTLKKPSNTKTCSLDYWCKTIDTLSKQKKLNSIFTQSVKNDFKIYIN